MSIKYLDMFAGIGDFRSGLGGTAAFLLQIILFELDKSEIILIMGSRLPIKEGVLYEV
jgi:hypothetical protein